MIEYDEFSMFHENAEEYGIAYDGPPTVRRESVDLGDGRNLSALVWGEAAPELVFLHGGAQNAHTWDTVALALDRPLVCIDLPGHGHSDGGRQGSLGVHDNAADVATAIRALAPDAKAVIGMSLGGITTIALTSVAPELVRNVVLVDVTPRMDPNGVAGILGFMAARMHKGFASLDEAADLLDRAPVDAEVAAVVRDAVRAFEGLGCAVRAVDSGRAAMDAARAGTRDERCRALVQSIIEQQWSGKPVHEWEPARLSSTDWTGSYRTVGQMMTRDLFTVHPEDVVDLVASMMHWKHVRHVPVEDNEGRLIGIVSHRTVLRLVADGLLAHGSAKAEAVAVREIMKPDPIAIRPECSVLEAIATMRRHRVSCLPVTNEDGKLVGIVTERDFLAVAARLFEQHLREDGKP